MFVVSGTSLELKIGAILALFPPKTDK